MTPLGGLVEVPRGAILKSKDSGDSRLDWDPAEVDNGASQLWAAQAIGESRTHSGTFQASDFKRKYQNEEFLLRQRPGLGGMAALPPSVSQVPGKYLLFGNKGQ